MIPVFIIWLIRRYRRNHDSGKKVVISSPCSRRQRRQFVSVIAFAVALLPAIGAYSQKRLLNYQILRHGSQVGSLQFSETKMAGMDYLKMESDVETRFIFTFTAHANEEAVYCNGILVRSSIYRQLNGNEKANKQHQAGNRQYIIHSGKDLQIAKVFPITYSMLSLYSREPDNVSKVYSDNYETFIPIEKAAPHKYKIVLPDGNYNYYYYKDGTLSLVEVHHSLYSANIVLTDQK